MKIVLATQSLHPKIGGPAYSVGAIGRNLAGQNVTTRYVTAQGWGYVPNGERGSLLDVISADVVHAFGLWTAFSHAVALGSRWARRPTVLCPLGMLEPWCLAHHGRRKKLGMRFYQMRNLEAATALHATAESEVKNLRALGLTRPIALIPHGVDFPATLPEAQPRAQGTPRTCLFMSRIHPKKGLMDLVEAWAALRPSGWRVVIAGPHEGNYRAKVEQAIRRHGMNEIFSFVGHVAGKEKERLLLASDLFVLPTYSENFGLVVPEALSYRLPVLTTTGAPWRELQETGSGWWIEPGIEPLTKALAAAFALPDEELRQMGFRGRRMVEERYGWRTIIARHILLYRWLLGNTTKPHFVHD